MCEPYSVEHLYLVALDPVHVGAGGHQLGRVDLPIVREPGTKLPKVPGTSLSGAARHYAALVADRPEVAGQHKKRDPKLHTVDLCPVMATFGTAADSDSAGSRAGAVRIGDARIMLFPVWSKKGPVWVATKAGLESANLAVTMPAGVGKDDAVGVAAEAGATMNFGWIQTALKGGLGVPVGLKGELAEVFQRVYVLGEHLFSVVVNSGLEVRTSVSIDPETGAAAKGALFSYEAIPRGTWMWLEAVEDNSMVNGKAFGEAGVKPKNGASDECWKRPMDVLKAGLRRVEHLGVGGMGTRGFGRMKLVEVVR